MDNLDRLGDDLLAEAATRSAGRAARNLLPSTGPLRQTLLALLAGQELGEHENPGTATLHVVRGAVRLSSGDSVLDLRVGDHTPIPGARHALAARDDTVVLLTVVPRAGSS